ncbi:hypothetical protein CONLIGDRAFT_144939 [Coniochaeta ligniaria NRRL 30616]|uniref:Uncharacterized protein n=1 Tax=Coniochaeta ligniaria NRRL 30616 TaxID=1408157 RepID=A0A1J7IP91_9PEZI|nr:hypothetical protein CONLIGDRAFT_144939 [Coniochaeta ligniaria NRRL 30616]
MLKRLCSCWTTKCLVLGPMSGFWILVRAVGVLLGGNPPRYLMFDTAAISWTSVVPKISRSLSCCSSMSDALFFYKVGISSGLPTLVNLGCTFQRCPLC